MSGIEIFLTALSVVSTVCAIVFGYSAFHARRKQSDTDSGRDRGVMLSDIGYIKARMDDLMRDWREMTATISNLSDRVARIEESVKQAHKRISELKGIKGDPV